MKNFRILLGIFLGGFLGLALAVGLVALLVKVLLPMIGAGDPATVGLLGINSFVLVAPLLVIMGALFGGKQAKQTQRPNTEKREPYQITTTQLITWICRLILGIFASLLGFYALTVGWVFFLYPTSAHPFLDGGFATYFSQLDVAFALYILLGSSAFFLISKNERSIQIALVSLLYLQGKVLIFSLFGYHPDFLICLVVEIFIFVVIVVLHKLQERTLIQKQAEP